MVWRSPGMWEVQGSDAGRAPVYYGAKYIKVKKIIENL